VTQALNVVVAPPTARKPRSRGLLTDVATPWVIDDAGNADRWMLGVKFLSWPRGFTRTTWNCSVASLSGVNDFGSEVAFEPFLFYAGVRCSTLTADFDEFRANLTADARLAVSSQLAAHLMDSGAPTNFIGSAHAVASSAALPPTRALGTLDDALNAGLGGGEGIIYVPGVVAAAAWGLIDADEEPMMSPSGHRYAIDPAFAAKPTVDNGSALGAAESYAYASGPIFVKTGEPKIYGNDFDQVDRTSNTVTMRALTMGIAVFDPATVYAARICLAACS
jgi:hypothetical protein